MGSGVKSLSFAGAVDQRYFWQMKTTTTLITFLDERNQPRERLYLCSLHLAVYRGSHAPNQYRLGGNTHQQPCDECKLAPPGP